MLYLKVTDCKGARMGLFGRKSKEERFRNNPLVQNMISSVERYGTYDGSPSSRATAQRVFDMQANHGGCVNPDTKKLYWEALEAGRLYMPLAACYAFAIGEFLAMPFYDPIESGGNTSNARMNADAMGTAFPSYKSFVSSRHSTDETRYILALSLNMIDVYR